MFKKLCLLLLLAALFCVSAQAETLPADEAEFSVNPFDEDDTFADPEVSFRKIDSVLTETGWNYAITWDILLDAHEEALPVRYTVYKDGTAMLNGSYTQSGRRHAITARSSDAEPAEHIIQLYVETEAPDGTACSNICSIADEGMIVIIETGDTFTYSKSIP